MIAVAFGAFVDDHGLDGFPVRSCYGDAGAAFGRVVPPRRAEGCPEETGGKRVAGEGACSAGDVAAIEGGRAGVCGAGFVVAGG